MMCQRSGFIIQRHNELRDLEAEMLRMVCNDASSETQGQSVGRIKRRDESFQAWRKSPWVPTLTGSFPNGQENAGSWLGTKNALYYCAQQFLLSSFREFVHDGCSPQLPGSFTKLSYGTCQKLAGGGGRGETEEGSQLSETAEKGGVIKNGPLKRGGSC